MGGQDRSYLSLTFCNLLNLSEWAQEHLNDTEAFAWIFYIDWLHLLTKSSGLVFSNHDKGQGKKKSDVSYIKQLPYLCLREKVLALIAPIQFKSIGSFDPFSKGGGSDSQVGVDVLEIGDTSNLLS